MGSTAILIGGVALGTGLICLFLGYRWGRSNVRAQIEDALDMARVSADAREFALREQLDDAVLDLGELRARADEVSLLQQQLEQLQASRLDNSPSGRTAAEVPDNGNPRRPSEPAREAAPVALSAEKTMQNFLNSKEEEPNQTGVNQALPLEEYTRRPVARFPVRFPQDFTPQNTTPEPAKSPAIQPLPAVDNDDWAEFAKSLEALKSRQK